MALCLDGFAGNGQRRLVGFIMANIATGLAYLSIPILLYKFVKNRKERIFNRVFICFMLFIFCGTTHFVDAIIFCSVIPTQCSSFKHDRIDILDYCFVLYRFLPKALQYRSPADLQLIIEEQTKRLSHCLPKVIDW
jgi:hypothetical protein